MLVAIWPLVILLAGVLLWVLASNAVLKTMGQIAFAVGLLVTTLVLARQTIKVGQAAPPAPPRAAGLFAAAECGPDLVGARAARPRAVFPEESGPKRLFGYAALRLGSARAASQ